MVAQSDPVDVCVVELGTLGESSAEWWGYIAADEGCVSVQRDAGGAGTFYARRHVFTLDAPTRIFIAHGATDGLDTEVLLLAGRSADGSGAVVGRSGGWLDDLLLAAGTYTIEITTTFPGDTGDYWVSAGWVPPDACVREWGTLDASTTPARAEGIVAADAGCVSTQRDAGSDETFYARRHVFTLDSPAAVTLYVSSMRFGIFPYLLLLEGRSTDGSGAVIARYGVSGDYHPSEVGAVGVGMFALLAAGTYTLEVTTRDPSQTGHYSATASWELAHEPVAAAVTAGGDSVELTYDVALDEASIPPASAFGVTVDGAERSIGSVSIDGAVVALALASPVAPTQTVTVSYSALPRHLRSATGAPAIGFTDRPVTNVPDAPRITHIAPGNQELAVTWELVAGMNAYDIQWRQDGETHWQSAPRTAIRTQYTLGGLTNAALYWVRIRGATTTGGADGATLHTTNWSAPVPQIVGDWTPPNLQITPDDEALVVAWGHVPVATGFETEYWPLGMVGQRAGIRAVRVGDGWFARITGLTNGEPYGVAVRSVARAVFAAGSGTGVDEILMSRWLTGSGRPGGFSVEHVDPRFVSSGATATISVRLIDADGEPFAGAQMGAELSAGPTFDTDGAAVVSCDGGCVTDGDGYVTLAYEVAPVRGEQRLDNIELIRLYWDTDSDGRYDAGTDPPSTASVHLYRPVNYVALGDSYSSGENGATGPDGEFNEDGQSFYLNANDSANECRRWSLAFSQVLDLAVYPLLGDVSVSTFACTGAIAYNVYDPDDADGDGVLGNAGPASSSRPVGADGYEYTVDETNRPSVAAAVPRFVVGLPVGQQDGDWEPRQVVSLNMVDDGVGVDMVTITIGGNDLLFSQVIRKCVEETCSDAHFGGLAARLATFREVGARIREVLREVKRVTSDGSVDDREATVFVLGYPSLTPSVPAIDCAAFTAGPTLGPGESVFHWLNDWFDTLPIAGNVDFYEISSDEQRYLRLLAGDLNREIRLAATAERVHFVDVAAAFDGHDPCASGAWLNGVVGTGEATEPSARSFHPNAAGHAAYADVVRAYIERAVRDVRSDPDRSEATGLTAAGLPLNPNTALSSLGGSAAGSSGGVAREPAEAAESSEKAAVTAPERAGLRIRRASAAVSCGLFSPGEQVTLIAEGFAPASAVSLAVFGISAAGTALSPAAIPAAIADADGRIAVPWVVPSAPEAATDAVPRGYVVTAAGARPGGAALVAGTPRPIVAYPGTAPCAVDDTAATMIGRAVRIAVLSNDTAPTGGFWDAASIRVESVHNADIVVDPSDGSLTYTPDSGFVGTDTFSYWVYDNWGIGVRAEVTVEVTAGCTITGTAGVTEITGTDGDDVICVPDPDDPRAFHIIDGRGGDDAILGGDGIDWIDGGPGRDTIYARRGADRVDGGPGADVIHSGRGFDTIHSSDLADAIHDTAGDDIDGYELILELAPVAAPSAPVAAGDEAYATVGESLLIDVLSNDFDPDGDLDDATLLISQEPAAGAAMVAVSADTGAHIVYTAGTVDGVDTFTYVVCDNRGACSTATVTVTVGASRCTITGTAGDDTLSGTPDADVICGLGGDDVIEGLGGDDVLIGGAGDDLLRGGDGDDVLFGGAGDDDLYGGVGADVLWGGAGRDALEGNSDDDSLHGGPGVDGLFGDAGNDTLWGGAGGDSLIGHAGNDTLHGGAGDDTLVGGVGADVLWGGPGDDSLTGLDGADTLRGGSGADTLWGNTQNDVLHGGAGNDTLRGGGHDDQLIGGPGGDSLRGDAGDDRLFGGWGDDGLDGGVGADYLGGGPGIDICRRGETTARCES
ncbi:MAG: hypothetical protein F4X49_00635 [Acidimicrobiia bacterium]|nr:hypothetical protein [Acidimicrobiia bacterium]